MAITVTTAPQCDHSYVCTALQCDHSYVCTALQCDQGTAARSQHCSTTAGTHSAHVLLHPSLHHQPFLLGPCTEQKDLGACAELRSHKGFGGDEAPSLGQAPFYWHCCLEDSLSKVSPSKVFPIPESSTHRASLHITSCPCSSTRPEGHRRKDRPS